MNKKIIVLAGLLMLSPLVLANTIQQISAKPGSANAETFLNFVKSSQLGPYQNLQWNAEHHYFQQKQGDVYQYFQVYLADVNNNGKQDYVMTNIMEGSGNFSRLVGVYEIDGKQLKDLDISDAIKKGLKLDGLPVSCVNWYCYLAKPFLSLDKKQQVVMQFQNTPNEKTKVCRYVWAKGKFGLSPSKQPGCIGS